MMNVFPTLQAFEEALIEVAKRKGDEHQNYHNYLVIEEDKNARRLLRFPNKFIQTPEEWAKSKLFNPFYVHKNAKYIAKVIYKKLKDGTYLPKEPFIRHVPKPNGKKREVSTFEIPDDTISKKIFSQLLSKNKHRFSGLSYAYRDDRNAHFAIQDIAQDLSSYPRMFVAEFDFSDFFNSIKHEFLFKQLDQNSFSISIAERALIKVFLSKSTRGVPQGTSISLFLANVACWNLDRKFEREGVRFARYADDTLIWSDSYEKICACFNIIHDFSIESGVAINAKKSEGISLLSDKDYSSEITKSKTSVNFLGYNITHSSIGIKDSSVSDIKKQVSYLLYRNLIEPLKTNPHNARCYPMNDDEGAFASAIHQIRRYIYGDLTESTLSNYIRGTYKRLKFKGVMSYYPLVTNDKQLIQLDKWLISTILNSLKLRNTLLTPIHGSQVGSFPYNLNGENIIDICRRKTRSINGKNHVKAFQIPSFLRINKAIRLGIENDGILATISGKSDSYDY